MKVKSKCCGAKKRDCENHFPLGNEIGHIYDCSNCGKPFCTTTEPVENFYTKSPVPTKEELDTENKEMLSKITEPIEKCTECQFEKGHSQGCSEYIAGKPFESTEPVTEDCELQQIKSEASIFFSKISEYLPKSLERSALGDEKIYRAFYQAFIEMRPYISRQTRLDLLNEIEGEIKKREIWEERHISDMRVSPAHRQSFPLSKESQRFNAGLQVGVDILNKHKK